MSEWKEKRKKAKINKKRKKELRINNYNWKKERKKEGKKERKKERKEDKRKRKRKKRVWT